MRLPPPPLDIDDAGAGHPVEPAHEEDLQGALPAPTGPPRAVLMLVQPRRLFLYWVLDAVLEERLRLPGGTAELRLEIARDGGPFREVDRQAFDLRAPGWYVPNTSVDCVARV